MCDVAWQFTDTGFNNDSSLFEASYRDSGWIRRATAVEND